MAKKRAEYHPKFDSAFTEELKYVEERWREKELRRWEEDTSLRQLDALERGDAAAAEAIEKEPEPNISFDKDSLAGLALSGGGIRSASFCMGVVQQLHVAGIMDRLHYMSTVSGGGYTGCSLTWFMSQGFGTQEDNFPFWGGAPAALRIGAPESTRQPKRGPVDGRTVLDYIRQRASYLNPGAGFTLMSAAAIVLRSTLTSLFAFVLLGALLLWLPVRFRLFDLQVWPFSLNVPTTAGIALLLLLGTSVIYYSLSTGIPQPERRAYERRRFYQRWSGTILAVALGMFTLTLLDWLMDLLSKAGQFEPRFDAAGLAAAASAIGTLGGLLTHKSADAKPGIGKTLIMAVVPVVSLLLLVAGLGMLAHVLAEAAVERRFGLPALVLLTAIYGVYTNVNLTGLHRFYRDRLMETFMPDPADVPKDEQAAQTDADTMLLADICAKDTDGPYHLINAHVVLLGAEKARQRSRTGDSFVLSRCYSGSEATGFIRTSDWVSSGAFYARPLGPMRLPTAMAISGAALNPRAGGDGQGATKGGIISALLTILNLRLGYWAQSPLKIHEAKGAPVYRLPPNLIRPGAIQGLFGFAHNERAHWLELTDGGHFENTGIYELVRRRVRTIIFADGSTDPDISLASFANLLQKIYVDFGVTVAFGEPADFTRMMKGSAVARPGDVLSGRFELSAAAYAVGTIRYPKEGDRDEMIGTLMYIKSAMTQDLPPGLYSYKAGNPLFPSESLAEQFFSEEQFEAYRALGFLQAASLVGDVRKNEKWASELGFPPPPAPPPPPPPSILNWILRQ
jgi:hypothetical protein